MTKRQSSKTPVVRKKSAKDYPYTDRSFAVVHPGMIAEHSERMYWAVRLLLEGPASRPDFKNYLEGVLRDAAFAFCRYLYARANGKRADAVTCWSEAQGIVEFELPMKLLHPAKHCRRRQSREKIVEADISIIRAKMPQQRESLERYYKEWSSPSAAKDTAYWKVFHLRKSLKRPAEDEFEELFSWVNEVVRITLNVEDVMRRAEHKAEKGRTRDPHSFRPIEDLWSHDNGNEETN